MGITKTLNLEKFQSSFLELTEANRLYVLGLIEGLRYAQEKHAELADSRASGKIAE
jgi:hypothetical protein